jgi:predicted nucleotide-binding protein
MRTLTTSALKMVRAAAREPGIFQDAVTFDDWRHAAGLEGAPAAQLVDSLLELERLGYADVTLDVEGTVSVALKEASGPYLRRVFVVHGHDDALRNEVELTLRAVKLEPVIISALPSGGRTIIEQIERYSDVQYAVVLLTPDDVGHSKDHPAQARVRARQNVVLELGYFMGRLGRDRVRALHRGDVELPSDYLGVLFTPVDRPNRDWRNELCRELVDAGLEVDLSGLL